VDRHSSAPWSFFGLSQNTQPVAKEAYLRSREEAFLAGDDVQYPNQKISLHGQLLAQFHAARSSAEAGSAAAAVLENLRKQPISSSPNSSSSSSAKVPFRDALNQGRGGP
jgi:hypothetical protein